MTQFIQGLHYRRWLNSRKKWMTWGSCPIFWCLKLNKMKGEFMYHKRNIYKMLWKNLICKVVSQCQFLWIRVQGLQLYEKSDTTNTIIFRSLIGKLLYITHTSPDIIFVVNLLSRFMNAPTKIQFWATKHILRYLKGTSKLRI